MATVGDELFVCEPNTSTVRVFTMGGEHLRNIKHVLLHQPEQIVFHKDQLFVAEEMGPIIYVMTPDGQLLQKYKMRAEETGAEVSCTNNMHILGNRLIVRSLVGLESPEPSAWKLLALKGV